MKGALRGKEEANVAGGYPRPPRADLWPSELKASDYLVRTVRYGIRSMPGKPFMDGLILSEIPQSEEDIASAVNTMRYGGQEIEKER